MTKPNKPRKKSIGKFSRQDAKDWDGKWSGKRATAARRKQQSLLLGCELSRKVEDENLAEEDSAVSRDAGQ